VDRNGGGSRNGGDGGARRRLGGNGGIGVRNIFESEERRMRGFETVIEPEIIVHLDVERGTQGVGKRGVGVVQIPEIRGINRGAR